MTKARESDETIHLQTDVLVIGAGGAGMYAAIAAARTDARVLLLDKSLIGRGGATVMAQMTVAVALGAQEPDDWRRHLDDTIAAGRGLTNERLARLLCREAPARILEMDGWKVGWAREDGHIKQAQAPGHGVARCVYVDFLNTGPAVSKTLRAQVNRIDEIAKTGDLCITDIVVADGRAQGAVGYRVDDGAPVSIGAGATVIATGGLTRMYQRNSASSNMGGDGYALALRAGAELVDMEFVQFFPIGHLAPRLIGMDPIMWDPFRYKLGGRLLNGVGEEFLDNYGVAEDGAYVAPRDLATYAIVKEVEAGRGSPHGGAYLSFRHLAEADLRAAFGPVIDRLAKNGIDLTETAIEVSPIAHYHMGGVRVDEQMRTGVEGLFAAGEAVGGPNGANRLSGNAISEALVFGETAGRFAAEAARGAGAAWDAAAAGDALALLRAAAPDNPANTAALIQRLQELMWRDVGPFRTAEKLDRALHGIRTLAAELGVLPPPPVDGYDMVRGEWFELRNMLAVAEAVARAARAREESRGAHQREDFPDTDPAGAVNQTVAMAADGGLALGRVPVVRLEQHPIRWNRFQRSNGSDAALPIEK